MACGMLAMLRNGIEIESYDAYEIDKYAIQTATHNFPDIKEHGDVFKADFTEYIGTINIMMGGSPCTYWSIAQATDRRETTASGIGWELFSQYIRALQEAKPDYFIYENNKSMSKAIYDSISDAFGFEPIMINSALVSAQNRQRLYWVGKRQTDGSYAKVEVNQPADRGIMLKDIIDGVVDREKSRAIIGSIGRTTPREYLMKNQGQVSFEPVNASDEGKARTLKAQYSKTGLYAIPVEWDGDEPTQAVSTSDGKTHKVYKVENGMICYKDKPYPIRLADGYYIIRKLMVSECKRLQTIPEWYHFPVSDTQAYKMLGNGWTVDVIAHIINCIVEERGETNG